MNERERLISVVVTPTVQYNATLKPFEQRPVLDLPSFDNTKLVAINTCPLWGIVRYTHHKVFGTGTGRAMALEAGSAAHEVFAAHRLYNFREYGGEFYGQDDSVIRSVVENQGCRIFGAERYAAMASAVDDREDFTTRCRQFCIEALNSCGFYDDPNDRRRTITNVEEMCVAYMDRFDWKNEMIYWDGDKFLGIEIPVDVVIEFVYVDDPITLDEKKLAIRFIGKADGVHYTHGSNEELRIHENKTASRLGDAWEMSWDTNHQPTGYMIALSAMLGMRIEHALMLGTCLPLPKAFSINGLARVPVQRSEWQIIEWFSWVLHTALIHQKYEQQPTDAPQYTHSCNRYFRPCSFIPLCASDPEERRETFREMTHEVWNPLHNTDGTLADE